MECATNLANKANVQQKVEVLGKHSLTAVWCNWYTTIKITTVLVAECALVTTDTRQSMTTRTICYTIITIIGKGLAAEVFAGHCMVWRVGATPGTLTI